MTKVGDTELIFAFSAEDMQTMPWAPIYAMYEYNSGIRDALSFSMGTRHEPKAQYSSREAAELAKALIDFMPGSIKPAWEHDQFERERTILTANGGAIWLDHCARARKDIEVVDMSLDDVDLRFARMQRFLTGKERSFFVVDRLTSFVLAPATLQRTG